MNSKLFVTLIALVAIMVLALPLGVSAQETDSIPPADALPCLAQGMGALEVNGMWTCTPGPMAQAAASIPTATTANTLVQVVPTPTTVFPAEIYSWGGHWVEWMSPNATPEIVGQVFPPLDPARWPTFPNVPNPLVPEFRTLAVDGVLTVPDGMEYGEDESQFCGAAGDQCELVIPARSIVLISGDFNIPSVGQCVGQVRALGCMAGIANSGDVAANLVGTFDNVFIIQGRYFNGATLGQVLVWAASFVVHNMTNGVSELNPAGFTNAGSNCSVPEGCEGVQVLLVITSGNEVERTAKATYVDDAEG